MLFGFGFAIVSGFLLTSVQSWTDIKGLQRTPLALVVATWISSRLLMAFETGLSGEVIAAVDLSFPICVTAAIAYPIIKVKQWRNLMFIPMLLALTLLNAKSHWGVNTDQPGLAMQSLHSTIVVFVLLIAILGGRIIPGFTASSTHFKNRPTSQWLEVTSIGSIILLAVALYIGFHNIPSPLATLLCGVGTLANGWRFLRWGIQYSWGDPLLWSLHLAYAFIPLGFLFLTLQSAGFTISTSTAIHSYTVGAMGGMILAMLSRITLGHTGRPMELPRPIIPAYLFILSAGLFRVVLPAGFPVLTQWGITIAAVLWIFAYTLFSLFYGPMLVKSRVDGKPG